MFIYDSIIDVYKEVFEEIDDESVLTDTSSVKSYKSFRSRRLSVRSTNNYDVSKSIRIISKTGRLNVFSIKIPKKYTIYFKDLGNTLLNTRWRWIIITLCLVNFLSFFLFGLVFMFIAYLSGDFDENSEEFCIVNANNLTGYILLSIETMLTIGYGYRYPTEKCKYEWTIPLLQALVSIGIQGVFVSAVYVKVTKPYTKNSLGLFTKKAVICLRDGKLCFMIRVADLNRKISVGTNITMYFIRKAIFPEEKTSLSIKKIKVEPYGFTFFPLEIVHVIDAESPFWNLTPNDLLTKPLEIVVVAEGLSMITGQSSQNRSSYVNSDIFWGSRFATCVDWDEKKSKYVINHKNINKIIAFDTPLCSAETLYKFENNEQQK